MREAVGVHVGSRGVSCWVGAWDHDIVEVKMATSEHLICVPSIFAMVRAQGRTQNCSSAPFDPSKDRQR